MISFSTMCEFAITCLAPPRSNKARSSCKKFTVFVVQETKEGAPGGFMGNPAFEPKLVETVAGSIAVAFAGRGPD